MRNREAKQKLEAELSQQFHSPTQKAVNKQPSQEDRHPRVPVSAAQLPSAIHQTLPFPRTSSPPTKALPAWPSTILPPN